MFLLPIKVERLFAQVTFYLISVSLMVVQNPALVAHDPFLGRFRSLHSEIIILSHGPNGMIYFTIQPKVCSPCFIM